MWVTAASKGWGIKNCTSLVYRGPSAIYRLPPKPAVKRCSGENRQGDPACWTASSVRQTTCVHSPCPPHRTRSQPFTLENQVSCWLASQSPCALNHILVAAHTPVPNITLSFLVTNKRENKKRSIKPELILISNCLLGFRKSAKIYGYLCPIDIVR